MSLCIHSDEIIIFIHISCVKNKTLFEKEYSFKNI